MKRIVWPEKPTIVGGALILLGTGTIFTHDMIMSNIPYSYRGTLLDILDYVAGKNLFKRANSLQ